MDLPHPAADALLHLHASLVCALGRETESFSVDAACMTS